MNWAMKSGTPKMAGEVRSYKQAPVAINHQDKHAVIVSDAVRQRMQFCGYQLLLLACLVWQAVLRPYDFEHC